jgi:intracellular sulfur oxidation DsrE/DsrF family protein
MKRILLLLFVLLAGTQTSVLGQAERQKGPVIQDYGGTYAVDDPDYRMDPEMEYRVVFDITYSPEKPEELNKALETPARFLNMHVGAGKDRSTLRPVMVVHGGASYGLLKNEYYKEKYGVDNPNTDLIAQLVEAGVEIYLCGQTAAHRNLSEERRLPGIGVSLSAMTILIELQQQGFATITLK